MERLKLADSVKKGDVVIIGLDPTIGREMRKTRACVVISSNLFNTYSETFAVVPVTHYDAKKEEFPFCVVLEKGEGGIKEKSIVNCSQIRTVDERRITKKGVLGNIDSRKMEEIEYAIKAFLGMSIK